MKRLNKVDLFAGLFVMLIGAVALQEALRFNLGTARAMGPGYFPFYIGVFLLILGCGVIFIEGLRPPAARGEQAPIVYPLPRTILFITAALLAFAFLIERAGLVPAVGAAVLLSCLADREQSLRQIAVLTIAIPILCVVVFQWALSMQVQAFRWYY